MSSNLAKTANVLLMRLIDGSAILTPIYGTLATSTIVQIKPFILITEQAISLQCSALLQMISIYLPKPRAFRTNLSLPYQVCLISLSQNNLKLLIFSVSVSTDLLLVLVSTNLVIYIKNILKDYFPPGYKAKAIDTPLPAHPTYKHALATSSPLSLDDLRQYEGQYHGGK